MNFNTQNFVTFVRCTIISTYLIQLHVHVWRPLVCNTMHLLILDSAFESRQPHPSSWPLVPNWVLSSPKAFDLSVEPCLIWVWQQEQLHGPHWDHHNDMPNAMKLPRGTRLCQLHSQPMRKKRQHPERILNVNSPPLQLSCHLYCCLL